MAPGQELDLTGSAPKMRTLRPGTSFEPARIPGFTRPVPVLDRIQVVEGGSRLPGPAIIVDTHATTWLAPGWTAWRDPIGNLHLERATTT